MILNLNSQIIWVFVNLLILYLLMRHFLFGPVTKMMDDRAKSVADTLDQADARLQDAEHEKEEYTRQLAQAQSEAARIIKEAQKRAELAYSRRMDEAEQDVQRLNEQAARQREADHAAMMAQAKSEIAALVLMTTAKVSQHTLNADTDRAMLDSFLDEAGDEV